MASHERVYGLLYLLIGTLANVVAGSEVLEAPKVNGFGFSFVKVKSLKKKPTTREPFDIQKVAHQKPNKPRQARKIEMPPAQPTILLHLVSDL